MSDSRYPMNGGFMRGGGSGTANQPNHERTDTLLECLSHHHRRVILNQLRDQSTITESEVLEQLARPHDRARVQLRHQHLPKLMRAGYVHWNQQTNEITRGMCFEEAAQVLKHLSDHADELPGTWP